MPYVTLTESPLANRHNVSIYYRELGSGLIPLLFLHGGWGYQVYPFDRQIEAFSEHFRILIPDRSGYGKSERIETMSADFHLHAALEMRYFLDALEIDRALLWGHSDGSVISAHMGLQAPEKYIGIVLEAFHYYRDKPGSHEFFETMMTNPSSLGERVMRVLADAHGEEYWETLIRMNGNAWLRIAEEATHSGADLFDGRLSELRVPTLFLHGRRDPRTEPDEMARVGHQLPTAQIRLLEAGGHSPHSESASAIECIDLAREFFDTLPVAKADS